MFKSMKRIIKWAGKYKGRLYLGSVFSFFSSLSTAIPTMAAAYALDKAIAAYWAGNTIESSLIWQTLWIIVGSIALNFLLSYLRAVLQESIGYEVAAGQRIHLGDVLKRVPIRDLPPYVFVMIGLYAGLRREEILALQWDSVYLDTDTPYLTVRRAWHTEHNRPVISDELKTKAAERNIPLPVCLAECLKAAKETSTSEYVVPNRDGDPLSYTTSTERVQTIAHNVDNRRQRTPLFTYYDENYTGSEPDLGSVVSTTLVHLIRVQVQVDNDPLVSPVPFYAQSMVHLRNLKTN